MSLGTNSCGMLSGVIVRLNLSLECVTESVRYEILQFCQVSGTPCHARAVLVWWVDKSTVPGAAKNQCFWPVNEGESDWNIQEGYSPAKPHTFGGLCPPNPLCAVVLGPKNYIGGTGLSRLKWPSHILWNKEAFPLLLAGRNDCKIEGFEVRGVWKLVLLAKQHFHHLTLVIAAISA